MIVPHPFHADHSITHLPRDCNVPQATTIYCAALYANLQITERHNHIYVIHYWPAEGLDATVDWGHLDFRFRNNKEYPIRLRLTHKNDKLTADITGTADGITVKLEQEVTEKTSFNTVYKKPSSENPEGKIIGGDKGKVIRVWKRVYQDGKFVGRRPLPSRWCQGNTYPRNCSGRRRP